MRLLVGATLLVASIGIGSTGFAKTLALKDFRQVLISMSIATNVNYRDPEIQSIYQRVRTRLPLNGAVEDMSSPMILAVTELAGAFCDKMIKTDAELDDHSSRHAHREVDFRRGPGALTDATLASVAHEYALLFWQRAPTSEEHRMLIQALQAGRDESTGSSQVETIETLKVGCAVTATSLAALLN